MTLPTRAWGCWRNCFGILAPAYRRPWPERFECPPIFVCRSRRRRLGLGKIKKVSFTNLVSTQIWSQGSWNIQLNFSHRRTWSGSYTRLWVSPTDFRIEANHRALRPSEERNTNQNFLSKSIPVFLLVLHWRSSERKFRNRNEFRSRKPESWDKGNV